jgi:hypothetical protein
LPLTQVLVLKSLLLKGQKENKARELLLKGPQARELPDDNKDGT